MSVTLLYGGQLYANWTDYSAQSDLDRPAAEFRFRLRAPPAGQVPVTEGGIAELLVDGVTVLWGRVDEVASRRDLARFDLELSGRDAGGLLVDASADPTWAWRDMKLSQIVGQICRYVGIPREPNLEYDPQLPKAKAEPGESCWSVVERLVTAEGMRVWVAADGHLEVGQILTEGAPVAYLVRRADGRGNNILASEVRRGTADAYSEVTVLAQRDDESRHSRVRGTWTDLSFPYFRPRVETDSDVRTATEAESKAAELGVRARPSRWSAEYTVPGHAHEGGPWAVNTLVGVQDEWEDVDGLCVLTARRFVGSAEEGTRSYLTLARREDFVA